jgi:aspartate aminotransferase-like enzyme
VVTVVHCDTPCGSLIASKDMQAIGEAVQAVGGLFLVDFVSSCGGWVVDVGRWRVDVGCFAMQKCLGLAPTLCSVTLSPRAVQWVSGSPNAAAKPYTSGYDVLAPWLGVVKRLIQFNSSHNDCIICSTSHTVVAAAVAAATVDCDESFDYSFPYTLDYDSFHQLWHRLAGLLNQGQLIDAAAINETTVPGDDLMEYFNREPGLVANHWLRHLQAQRYAIDRLSSVRGGLELFITQPAMRSPTCTALLLPPNWLWSEWKRALAARGVYVSGGGGAGDRVFRLGHMGPQASIDNLKRAIDIMEQILLLQQH